MCCYVGSGTILNAVFETDLTWDEPEFSDLLGPRVQAPLWIAIAFGAVVRFFSYIDQRIRIEGWEVELRLKVVAAVRSPSSPDCRTFGPSTPDFAGKTGLVAHRTRLPAKPAYPPRSA